MNIKSTQTYHRVSNYTPVTNVCASNEKRIDNCQDSVTLSQEARSPKKVGRKKLNELLTIVGLGVSMTGIIAGAQANNPVVIVGSMFAGLALQVAGQSFD